MAEQETPPKKKPQPPAQELSGEEWAAAIRGEEGAVTDPEPQGIMARLLYGAKDLVKGQAELLRVEARGAMKGLDQIYQTAFDIVGVDRPDILTNSPENIEALLGPKADDFAGQFAESATQFLTNFLIFRGAGAGNILSGAISDGSAFDPYEASLSELAAKAPKYTGLHELGEALSVDEDDDPVWGRIKRSAEGAIAAKILEGLFGAARWVYANKLKSRPGATPADIKRADEIIARSEKAIREAAEGEGDNLNVRQNENGTFRVEVKPLSEAEKHLKRLKELDAEEAGGPPATVAEDLGEPEGGLAAMEAREAAREPATEVLKRNRAQHGIDPNKPTARGEEVAPKPEVVADNITTRGEAEMVRTVGEDAINARVPQPKAVTPEQASNIVAATKRFLESGNPDDLAKIEGGTHFNFSYAAKPDEALATIEAISEVMAKEIDKAQKVGGVAVEETIRQARRALGGFTEARAPEAIAAKLGSTKALSSWLLAGDMVMKHWGRKIASMADMLDSRPGDAIAHEEARIALSNLFELQRTLAGSNSETGRALRILQERANPLAQGDIKFMSPEDAARRAQEKGVKVEGKPTSKKLKDLEAEKLRQEKEMEIHPLRKPKPPKPEDLGIEKSGEVDPTEGLAGTADDASPKLESGKKDRSIKTAKTDTPGMARTAGMTHREIRLTARMVKLAEGKPENVYAVAQGFRVFQQTGVMAKAMEVFANFLLSGPPTWITAAVSGAGTTAFEAAARMGGGILHRNSALVREGADIMWGNFKYVLDNLKSAATAFRAGHSIINPQAQHQAIGGVTGTAIRTPGRILTTIDEFIRVTNYRSFVRAKSLKLAREQGLKGAAIERRVQEDLAASFDPETGIARLPEALKYAEVPTFTRPLKEGSIGKGFHEFTNNHLEAKFIAPFVKTSTNLFNYWRSSTPILNRFMKEAREIRKVGGPDAAALDAREAMAGMIYAFATYQALQGNLTGRPPADPEVRAMWMKNNQPYSMKVGDKWVSYRRADPFGTFLGVVSDFGMAIQEAPEDKEMGDWATAIVASMVSNFANKTHMSGITQFTEAWGEGNAHAVERWMGNMAAGITVPALVSRFNPDDTYREVSGIGDAIISRIPGWSETLDARHNGFGEPILKAAGYLNRAINPFTLKDAGRSVEDDIYLLEQGIRAPATQEEGGMINLSDRSWDTRGIGKSPYVRWMELIREPKVGKPLREDIEDLVASPSWKNMSAGAEINKGGERWLRVQGLKERAYARAKRQMLLEYPTLLQEYRRIARAKGAAIQGGQEGVDRVNELFGVPPLQ